LGLDVGSTITVLAVSSSPEDFASVRAIFANSRWRLYQAESCAEAMLLISAHPIRVVISIADQLDGTWRDLLAHGALLRRPPKLIVASRFADDRLWAEALNLGAYDVLAMPLRAAEVFRSVSLAWRHWEEAESRVCGAAES
jgi:DNA-binding NtrC family response regulator